MEGYDDTEGCLDQQMDLYFLPSDDLEDSLMDATLRLIRLIVWAVDTIASSENLEGAEGEEINQSCPSRTT